MLKIVYSCFTLGRLTTLASKIKNHLSTKFPDHPMVISLVGKLNLAIQVGLQSLGSTTKQGLTKLIRQADSFRDDSYTSLRDHVKAGLSRHNAAYQEACKALWAVFEKNGLRLYNLGDEEESSAIDSLLRDLGTTEMQAHLTTINAVEWLNELAADNQTFVDLCGQRSSVRANDNTVQDNVAFMKVKSSLELMRSTMETLAEFDSVEGLEVVQAEVNQFITEANAAAKTAAANRESGEEEEAEAEEEAQA